MAVGIKKCRICGKEYEYCRTKAGAGVFRWQDVACCPEHGSEYFTQVLAARAATSVTEPETAEQNSAKMETEADITAEPEKKSSKKSKTVSESISE